MKYSILFFCVGLCWFLFLIPKDLLYKPIIKHDHNFYIHTGSDFNQLTNQLDTLAVSLNPISKKILPFFLKKKRLDYWFRPGRYTLKKSYSLNDVVNKLRSQSQDPVNVTFNSMDDITPVLGILDRSLELDSLDLVNYFNSINLHLDSLYFLFIPNTYEFFWNVSPKEFLNRMYLEYDKFWNFDRVQSAKHINLSKKDVFILASIVDKEASHFDEMPRIAGLYLNRLQRGWPLAADPTIIYIWKEKFNQSIRRVRHKHIDNTKKSLFNTYHNKGLPPMPICIPSLQAIESVLLAEEHQYMYMCARPDNSEYHNFSKTHREHQKNADAFHDWLNKRKIY